MVEHEGTQDSFGFFQRVGKEDALPRGEPRGLDDEGPDKIPGMGEGLAKIREQCVPRCRDSMTGHEILGE